MNTTPEKSQYKSLSEWMRDNPKDYIIACRNGWLVDICEKFGWEQHKKSHRYWTKERCVKDAKEYKSIKEWRINGTSSYSISVKNGWLVDIYNKFGWEITNPKGYWTKEKCITEAKKFKTRNEWYLKSSTTYSTAVKNGWLDECAEHMELVNKPDGYWTKEKCITEARKFKIKERWKTGHSKSYQAARKSDWFDECVKHMKSTRNPKGYWTKEKCITEAKKFKTRNVWYLKSSGSYKAATQNGWFDECTKHMVKSFTKDKERCITEAKKYKTRNVWQKKSSGSYKAATQNGWFDECVKHMK
tara:strand:+ start:36819 stop:37721 length:903 start_codon:yes stop_codon:yes gene_type:complete